MSYRDEWIKMLESGELKQTTGKLHRAHDVQEQLGQNAVSNHFAGYCCLGVGLKCIGYTESDMGDIATFLSFASGMGIGRDVAPEEDETSPQPLYDQLEINEDVENFLVDLNDKAKLSFKEIAALLRQGNDAVRREHRIRCPSG